MSKEQNIKNLIADLKEIIFGETWARIESYHLIGKRLLEENLSSDLLTQVANELGKSTRTLYYAIDFAKKYPDINKLPAGKKITWRKIRNQLLAGKPIECPHTNKKQIIMCSSCGKRL